MLIDADIVETKTALDSSSSAVNVDAYTPDHNSGNTSNDNIAKGAEIVNVDNEFNEDFIDENELGKVFDLDDAVVPATQVISDGLFIDLELVLLDGVGSENMDNQAPPSADNNLSITQQPGKATMQKK